MAQKITKTTPSGATASMTEDQWNQYYKSSGGFQRSEAPARINESGGVVPSGAETQAARVATIRENSEAINNWRQQEEIRKGQGAQMNGPINMFGQPIESFWVKADPATGKTPIPELKPMPSFGGEPDFIPKFPAFLQGSDSSVAPSQVGDATGSISSGFLKPFDSGLNGQSNLSNVGSYLSPAMKEREEQARSLGLGFEMSPFQQRVSGFNRNPTRAETGILGLRRGIQNLPALGDLTGGTMTSLSSSLGGVSQPASSMQTPSPSTAAPVGGVMASGFMPSFDSNNMGTVGIERFRQRGTQPSPTSTGFGNIFPENPSTVFNRRPRRTTYYA